MFRTILAAALVLGGVACGDDNPAASSEVATTHAGGGAVPTVELPSELPSELVITDLVEGTGPEAAEGDSVYVRYVGVRSEDGEQFDENFSGGDPLPVQIGAGGVIEGWDAGLVGIRQGGRRQLDIPAEMAYDDAPRGEVIRAGDPLTFVIDALAVVPTASAADQPDVTVEAAANQDELTFDDLIVGDGAEATEGASAAVQVTSYRADTGEELSSTYTGGVPLVFVVGDGSVIPGLDDTVTGMHAGGRRQAHVPFALAFGEEGRPGASVPGSLDIVLVVDLVTVF